MKLHDGYVLQLFSQSSNLVFRSIRMPEFASWMQTVLDRTVDGAQFAIFGLPPHPSTAPHASLERCRAIQERVSLKLTPKTQGELMVLDHVNKPI